MTKIGLYVLSLLMPSFMVNVNCLRCFACMGTQPGCNAEQLDFMLVRDMECPGMYDVCVKISERILGTYLTTRGCLSVIAGLRHDIPSDRYEGCRQGADEFRFNNNLLPMHPHSMATGSPDMVFCFCSDDDYCNSTNRLSETYTLAWTTTLGISVTLFWQLLFLPHR